MLEDDFVENFIESCIVKGVKKQQDICNLALKEIQENDEKLRESNKLRIRNKNLKKVLRELGHESLKRPVSNEEIRIFENLNDIEDSAYHDLMINICGFVELNIDKSITSRDLINDLGSGFSEKEIYMCLKNLYDAGILTRSGNKERNIVFGPNWNKRFNLKDEELNNKSA
jgi:hypothetical protein